MPHIHDLYDFVVSVFVVHRDKVLLVFHHKYQEWLPIGGHVELNEDPDVALMREIQEESGLPVKILGSRPPVGHSGVKPLLTPAYMDSHKIGETHRHIAFVYFATAKHDRVKLHTREHREFKWVSRRELASKELKLTKSIKFYCQKALEAAC